MLISASARTAEISAKMPVKEKSKGPGTFKRDQPVSDFSEFNWMEELQTIDDVFAFILGKPMLCRI